MTATGDLTSGLLIAHSNDTVTEFNQQARSLVAVAGRLHGTILGAGERVFQIIAQNVIDSPPKRTPGGSSRPRRA